MFLICCCLLSMSYISVHSNIVNYCNVQPNLHFLCDEDIEIGPKCGNSVRKFALTDNDRLQTLKVLNNFRSYLAIGKQNDKISINFTTGGANILEMTWDAECENAAGNIVKYCELNRNFLSNRSNIFSRFEAGFFFEAEESTTESKFQTLAELIIHKLFSKDATYFNSINKTTDLRGGSLKLAAMAEVSVIGCAMMDQYLSNDKVNQLVSCVFGGITQWLPPELYKKGVPCSQCPQGSSCSSSYSGLCVCDDTCYSLAANLTAEVFSSKLSIRQIQESINDIWEDGSSDAEWVPYDEMVEKSINYCDVLPNRHYLCEENIEVDPTCPNQKEYVLKYPKTKADKIDSLNVLNKFRSKVATGNYYKGGAFAPEGANIFELQWDDELENAAANIVKYCKFNPHFLTEKANIFYRFQTGLYYVSEPLTGATKEFRAMNQFIEYLLNKTSNVSMTTNATMEKESLPIEIDSTDETARKLKPVAELVLSNASNTRESTKNGVDGSSSVTKEQSDHVKAIKDSGADNGIQMLEESVSADANNESLMSSSEKGYPEKKDLSKISGDKATESNDGKAVEPLEKRKRAAMFPEDFQQNMASEQYEEKTGIQTDLTLEKADLASTNQSGMTTEQSQLATGNQIGLTTEKAEQETENKLFTATENAELTKNNVFVIATTEKKQRTDILSGRAANEAEHETEKNIEISDQTQGFPTQDPNQNTLSKAEEDNLALLMRGEPSLVGCAMMIQNTTSVAFFNLACVLGGITKFEPLYEKGKPCSQCPEDISICSSDNPGLCRCNSQSCQKLDPKLMNDVFLSNSKVKELLSNLDKPYIANKINQEMEPTTLPYCDETTTTSLNDLTYRSIPTRTSTATIKTTTTVSTTKTTTSSTSEIPAATTTSSTTTTLTSAFVTTSELTSAEVSPVPAPRGPTRSPTAAGAEPQYFFKNFLMIIHVSISYLVFLIIFK